jgi:hypothetical protein
MMTVNDGVQFGGDVPVWTDESRVLWSKYVDQWVTSEK